jgi:hypothetical protein
MNTTNNNSASVYQLNDYQPDIKNLFLFIITVRRGARRIVEVLDRQHDKARQYRRQARIIKERASPFDGARIAKLESMAAATIAACKPMQESLNECGKLLTDTSPMIDAGTTLAQRCEILNVNEADRGDLTEADGLHQIVFAHGLEDSAACRRTEWKNGPLFQASQRVFMDFLMNTKEGQALGDSLFQPGGMFADVPMFKEAADGSMERQPPRLYAVPVMDDSIDAPGL